MKSTFNSLYFGLILGLLAPFIVLIIVYFYKYNYYSFIECIEYFSEYFPEYIEKHVKAGVIIELLSLCVIPNLLLFFIFIWKNFLYSARGVILSTLIYAFVVIIFKVF